MLKIFKQDGNYSVNKIYLIIISLCTLLPGFGAIDNNPIRWMSIGFTTIFFLFYATFISQKKINFKNSTIVILSGVYLFFNCLTSDNINESLITLYKLIIIVSVFYACYLAIIKISDPFLFICLIFTGSLFFESIFTLIDFFSFKDSFTGISQNRNISSSSLVYKLIFLIYIIDHSQSFNKKLILKVLEIITLFSIIILQSRLGIISVLVIYFLYFILIKSSRKMMVFPILISCLFFLYFDNNDFQNKIEKDYTFENLSGDESINQRLSFYTSALSLFSEKPINGNGLASWKYKSINNSYKNNSVLVPYYTHNDFLQILMESGLIGLLIYLIFFGKLFKNIIKNREKKVFIPLTIALFIFTINSLINFPIHRTQEYIPFIICCAYILSNKNFEGKKSNILPVLIFLLIPSIVISSYEYQSLKLQGVLMDDYNKNKFSMSLNEVERINYKIPNLSSSVVPISTYLSRYFFNEGNYYESIRLLEYSLEINKLDLMTNELMLRNYIFTNQSNKALILVKDLLKRYPENKNYSNILLAISKDLNSKN
tara:strand:+ start:1594 stop:3222 length:1629 start_codon:yes stop_codon:yes gene_type:complete